jgi:hypothetical protein
VREPVPSPRSDALRIERAHADEDDVADLRIALDVQDPDRRRAFPVRVS